MKDNNPFFSVVTPVYNGGNYVSRYVDCLKNQSCINWESLIIDDNSNDNTIKLLEENIGNDKRFKIIKQEKSKSIKSPYLARNKGLEYAKGEYICFLDIDDYWKPGKLERHKKLIIKNPKIKLIFGSYLRQRGYKSKFKVRNPFLFTGLKNIMNYANVIPMLTTCLKKEIIKDTKFLPINHEDYFFWIEIIAKLLDDEILYDSAINSIYTINPDSISSSKIKASIWIWGIYRLRGFNKIKCLRFIFLRFLIQILITLKENTDFYLKTNHY